ncbi:MAG: hypothetical protein ACREYE_25835 [Gammaproteobacteria bacterium]
MNSIGGVAALTFGALLSASAHGTVIDTTPFWDRNLWISGFGDGRFTRDFSTIGQIFTVPSAEPVLDSFSFWINDDIESTRYTDFSAYVMSWDGGRAAGPILYSTVQQTTTNNHGLGGWEEFTFNTGGLKLVGEQSYIAFLGACRT